MAFSSVPTLVFGASYSENGTNMTIPLSAFEQLTAAEADAATGDSRKMIYAMVEKFYSHYVGLAAANRPARMVVTKSSGGLNASNQIAVNYGFNFTLGGDLDVVNE
jgi:hypothetical protein